MLRVLACAALTIAASGCGGKAAPTNRGEPADRKAELLRRTATNPKDRVAHRELARVYAAEGVKARALRHFERASEALTAADRQALADLLLERAAFRLKHDDLAAIVDVEAAAALVGWQAVPGELGLGALEAAAVAGFRRADRQGRATGGRWIRAAVARYGESRGQGGIEPSLAPLRKLGETAMWLEQANAKRVALDLYRLYRARNGDDAVVLLGLGRLERWWGQKSGPSQPEPPPTLEARVAEAVSQWASGATQTWPSVPSLEGAGLTDRAIARAESWAQPTLYRVAGDVGRAQRALDRVRQTIDSLELHKRDVVLAEIAVLDPDGAPMPAPKGAIGWLVAARAKLAEIPCALEARWTVEVPTELRQVILRTGFEFKALADAGDAQAEYALRRLGVIDPKALATIGQPRMPAVPGWVAPLGAVDPTRLATDLGLTPLKGELALVAEALAIDPALSERRAAELIDRDVAPHVRGPAVVELFVRAGDPALADRFATRLLTASPDHPPFLEIAAVRAAAAGDPARADVFAAKAAARSGDAGATLRQLTAAFLVSGANLLTIATGRKALGLSAPKHHMALRVLIARAMLRIERRSDAYVLLDHPSISEDRKSAIKSEELGERPSRLAQLTSRELAIALSFNPASPALLGADALSSSPTAERSRARLAALALYDKSPTALFTWAEVLERSGQAERAEKARREATGRSF